jgi:hypothetical protein
MDFVPLTPFFYTLSLFLQMAKVELRGLPENNVPLLIDSSTHLPPSSRDFICWQIPYLGQL